MSYQALETSEQDGKPIELYRFVVGGVVYRYTSAQQEVQAATATTETYLPLYPIKRSNVEQSRELARAKMEVTVPRNHAVASLFTAFVPASVLLTIYRQHDGDGLSNFIKLWSGTVNAVEWIESEAVLHCEPTLAILKRKGPRRNYGGTCQHALYSVGGCTMNKDNFRTDALLTAVVGDVLTATIIGTKPADWFPGGFAERTNGELRFIIGQSGNTVTVLVPFNNLLAGETIKLYAGCAHDIDTCATKFVDVDHPSGNTDNFMGFHVNPKRNPFIVGLK